MSILATGGWVAGLWICTLLLEHSLASSLSSVYSIVFKDSTKASNKPKYFLCLPPTTLHVLLINVHQSQSMSSWKLPIFSHVADEALMCCIIEVGAGSVLLVLMQWFGLDLMALITSTWPWCYHHICISPRDFSQISSKLFFVTMDYINSVKPKAIKLYKLGDNGGRSLHIFILPPTLFTSSSMILPEPSEEQLNSYHLNVTVC